MLKKIGAQTFQTYLMEEGPEVRTNGQKPTIFTIRRLPGQECLEEALLMEQVFQGAKSMDSANQARVIFDAKCDAFQRCVEKVENYGGCGGKPIDDPVAVRKFALEYMTPDQVNEITERAKNGFLLNEHDAELEKLRGEESGSSPGS